MLAPAEPGYYEDGAFGIRIENVLVVRRADGTPSSAEGTGAPVQPACANAFGLPGGQPSYLEFEPITCVPITTKLVDVAMLSTKERKWLNEYNAWVRKTLSPALTGHALEYLLRETFPV